MYAVFWLENLKGRGHWEDLSVDGKIILEWMLGKWCEGVEWIRLDQGQGSMVGCCEYGDEPASYIKGGGFID
jgi:hypothetical protein